MAKANLETVFLVSSEETGYFYSVRRKKGSKKKISVKKYDPVAQKHVVFQEKKLSRLKRKYRPGQKKSEKKTEPAESAE